MQMLSPSCRVAEKLSQINSMIRSLENSQPLLPCPTIGSRKVHLLIIVPRSTILNSVINLMHLLFLIQVAGFQVVMITAPKFNIKFNRTTQVRQTSVNLKLVLVVVDASNKKSNKILLH